MTIDTDIDEFVAKINAGPKEPLFPEDVPEWLQDGPPDKYGKVLWRIKKAEVSWIAEFERKLPQSPPPSFHSLISRYAFPGFHLGPIFLFANTGEKTYWELQDKIFADEFMSRTLFENGFLQIGRPEEANYDPICFDLRKRNEGPLVQIDHEMILLKSKILIKEQIAESFLDFLQELSNHS